MNPNTDAGSIPQRENGGRPLGFWGYGKDNWQFFLAEEMHKS